MTNKGDTGDQADPYTNWTTNQDALASVQAVLTLIPQQIRTIVGDVRGEDQETLLRLNSRHAQLQQRAHSVAPTNDERRQPAVADWHEIHRQALALYRDFIEFREDLFPASASRQAEQVAEAVRLQTAAYEEARDRHRNRSTAALLLVVAAFGTGAFLLGGLIGGTPPVGHTSADLVLIVSVRASLMLLVGFVLAFSGRAYRLHSGQAVFYTDRIAALNTISEMFAVAGRVERQEIIRQLLAGGRNAFTLGKGSAVEDVMTLLSSLNSAARGRRTGP